MFSNVKVSLFLALMGAVIVVSLLFMIYASRTSLDALRIGRPLYARIVLGKGLIAEILPPPESRAERVASLRAEYDSRHGFWLSANFDRSLQEKLTTQAHEPAEKLFEVFEGSFLQAPRKGNMEAARSSYADPSEAYAQHRAVIDEFVLAATARNTVLEAEAASANEYYAWLTFLAAAIAAFVSIAGLSSYG